MSLLHTLMKSGHQLMILMLKRCANVYAGHSASMIFGWAVSDSLSAVASLRPTCRFSPSPPSAGAVSEPV